MKNEIKYKINHPYLEEINQENDFVDVDVEFEGDKYSCSVTTTKFINERLEYYGESGENQNGSYFWAKGMIVLDKIDDDSIGKTLEDLAKKGNLEEFLKY